jgi:hypothetical protein
VPLGEKGGLKYLFVAPNFYAQIAAEDSNTVFANAGGTIDELTTGGGITIFASVNYFATGIAVDSTGNLFACSGNSANI